MSVPQAAVREWPPVSPPLPLIDDAVSCQEKPPPWQAAEGKPPSPIPVPIWTSPTLTAHASPGHPQSPTLTPKPGGAPDGPARAQPSQTCSSLTPSPQYPSEASIPGPSQGWTCQIPEPEWISEETQNTHTRFSEEEPEAQRATGITQSHTAAVQGCG